jgi:hypothetical protein
MRNERGHVDNPKILTCTICGEQRSGQQRRFLIAEDRWQDRLKILHWDDRLATYKGIHAACGPAHLEELVVHWMTTGCLDHPFARLAPRREPTRQARGPAKLDLSISAGRLIGELSVHRESMQRVLCESPHSLQTILDALLSAMQHDCSGSEPNLDWEEELVRSLLHEA